MDNASLHHQLSYMNKVANIFISLAFLVAFSGVQIHKHYSHGKLYSIAVFHEAQNCCATMESCQTANVSSEQAIHNHCSCKNETQWVKITDNFLPERFSIPVIEVHSLCIYSLSGPFQAKMSANTMQPAAYDWPSFLQADHLVEFGVFRC